jgi:hypothetical protein
MCSKKGESLVQSSVTELRDSCVKTLVACLRAETVSGDINFSADWSSCSVRNREETLSRTKSALRACE